MRRERAAQIHVTRHVLHIPQPHGRLDVHEQHPEHDRWPADALVGVPHVLHPHIRAGGEEQPMHRDEKEAEHVAGQRHADEENGEGEPLILEGVIDGPQQQIEWPEELEAELENEVGEDHQRPEDEEPEVKQCAANNINTSISSIHIHFRDNRIGRHMVTGSSAGRKGNVGN